MPHKKIQLLRSTRIYDSLLDAVQSFTPQLAQTAHLSDGEVIIARYKTKNPLVEDGPDIIQSVAAIYNSKNNMSNFTPIANFNEFAQLIGGMYFDGLNAATGGVLTKISQIEGTIDAESTPVVELTLDGYTGNDGVINDGDSLDTAFQAIIGEVGSKTVSSEDGSLNIDNSNGNQDLSVNVDDNTIAIDENTGELKTQLSIEKITSGLQSNIKEAYQLQDANGLSLGDQINIYYDSSLVEAYIGTKYDSVNSVTGVVKKVCYMTKTQYVFIKDEDVYNGLYEEEKALYDPYSVNTYTILHHSLGYDAYEELDESAKELYQSNDDIVVKPYVVKPEYEQIYQDVYDTLTQSQKDLYDEPFITSGYLIKEDMRYISQEEYEDIFGQITPHIYNDIRISHVVSAVDEYQMLNFVYLLSDNTYSMVKCDLSKFISEVEYGNGLTVGGDSFRISVNPGKGLDFGSGPANRRPLIVKIDDTSSLLTCTVDGVGVDTDSLSLFVDNILLFNAFKDTSSVDLSVDTTAGKPAIKSLKAEVKLDEETSPMREDLTYAAENGNILQVKTKGLYLASTWDCGDY